MIEKTLKTKNTFLAACASGFHRFDFVWRRRFCQIGWLQPIDFHFASTLLLLLTFCVFMASRPTTNTTRPWTSQSRSYSTEQRPWTAQSRPTTARSQTATSVRHEGSYVVAVLEGRGISREVGIAALDKDTGRVVLVQVCAIQ